MLLELFKIIIGVVSGTFIYVLTKFVLDIIYEQKRVIGEIVNDLTFYKNVYGNSMSPIDKRQEASDKLRKLASSLTVSINILPCYAFLEKIKAVKPMSSVGNTIMHLIGLSNNCLAGDIESGRIRLKEIQELLKITIPD
ncbi:MAG: hypothetical protein ACLP2P_06655 [Desulfobaccales bacterium]